LVKDYAKKNVTIPYDDKAEAEVLEQQLTFLSSLGLIDTIDKRVDGNKFIISVSSLILPFYTYHYFDIKEFLVESHTLDFRMELLRKMFVIDKGGHCAVCCDDKVIADDDII
jgi:hypothetical protein